MNDYETVGQLCEEISTQWATCYFSEGTKRRDGEYSKVAAIETDKLAERILAAHTREMAHNESLLNKAGETVVGLMNKMSAQHEEIKKLRALVKELADALEERLCDYACEINGECPAGMKKEECESFKFRALVAMAREVAK